MSYIERKNNVNREVLIHNTRIYKELKEILPKDVQVVINMNGQEDVSVMFYNNHLTANHFWFNEKELEQLKNRKVKIAAFVEHRNIFFPAYLKLYPYITYIDREIK